MVSSSSKPRVCFKLDSLALGKLDDRDFVGDRFHSGFLRFQFRGVTTSTGSEASTSSESDALHFSQPSSLLQVHSSGRLELCSVVIGMSAGRWARISAYITDL